MNQHDLELQVSERTGESLKKIRNQGFSLMRLGPRKTKKFVKCRKPQVVEWDLLDPTNGRSAIGKASRIG